MAGPYVCGPAHVFVGIDYAVLGVLGITPPNQAVNVSSMRPMQSLPVANPFGPPQGAAIVNNAPPPPPAVLTALLIANRLPVYLGCATDVATVQHEPAYYPWYDDEQGQALPADELYEGCDTFIRASFNYLNDLVYQFLATRVIRAPFAGRPGIDYGGDVGTSMQYEGFSYPVWLQFPNAAKAVFGGRGLVGGMRFYSCKLVDDALDDKGHEPMERALVWRASRWLDLTTGVSGQFDFDMTGLPAVN